MCNLLLGWTGNSWESVISTPSSNNSVCTWRVTMLYLPEPRAESQGCHSLVISWETLLFSLVGESEVCAHTEGWILGNFCEQEVSQQKALFRAESLQLCYLMLWELSCFTQLCWFLGTCVALSVSPPADCSGAGLVPKPCSAPASPLTWFSLTAY